MPSPPLRGKRAPLLPPSPSLLDTVAAAAVAARRGGGGGDRGVRGARGRREAAEAIVVEHGGRDAMVVDTARGAARAADEARVATAVIVDRTRAEMSAATHMAGQEVRRAAEAAKGPAEAARGPARAATRRVQQQRVATLEARLVSVHLSQSAALEEHAKRGVLAWQRDHLSLSLSLSLLLARARVRRLYEPAGRRLHVVFTPQA